MTRLSRWWIGIYGALGLACGLAYYTTRDYLIATPINDIVVSNLTVNYLLISVIVGGVTGWLSWMKLTLSMPLVLRATLTITLTLFVSLVLMLILAAGGYDLKW